MKINDYYVSIKGSLGFYVYAEKFVHQASYYKLTNDVFVCFMSHDRTVCRIPLRMIEEIKLCHILNDSEILYKSE